MKMGLNEQLLCVHLFNMIPRKSNHRVYDVLKFNINILIELLWELN